MLSQTGGLADRLAEAAAHASDPLARQGALEAYQALITDVGAPMEPFVALVLATILDKCSDKVPFLPLWVALLHWKPFASCQWLMLV